VVSPAGYNAGVLTSPLPKILDRDGRRYTFCSEPCQWVFEQSPARFQGHLNIVDRFLAGHIQPPTVEGAVAYMGLSLEEQGQDATNYAWAYAQRPLAVAAV